MNIVLGIIAIKIATEIWPNFGMICISGCN